jgi:uncharacterized protein YjdB
MKKFTTILFSVILGLSALAQEPVITMTTDLVVGSNITIQLQSDISKTVLIDFGDGNQIEKKINNTWGVYEEITGIVGPSKTIKVYGTNITVFNCQSTQLTTLDISKCPDLLLLECRYNKLKSLDLSNKRALLYLFCSYNQLNTLDLSNNVALERLECSNNLLSSLLITHPLTDLFECSYNQLTFSTLPYENVNWKNYFYAKQNPINFPKQIYVGNVLDLSSEYSVYGNNTDYKLYKKTAYALILNTDYTNNNGKITFLKPFSDSVYCEMTNASFPDFAKYGSLTTKWFKVVGQQTITFNTLPDKKANEAAFNLSATASSGLAVTFTSSDPSIASVSGNTVTIKKAGTVTITATQAGDDSWEAAPSVPQTLTISKTTQTIAFNALPAKKANEATFTISATATSGLAVAFTSSDPSIASVSGNSVTIKKAGSVTITAAQAGDDSWEAALTVTQTLTISKATQTITFNTLPTKKATDAAFTISATASSGLTVAFTSSDPSIASVSGNTVTIKKAGSVTITASQAGDDTWSAASSVAQALTISKANQTISFDALPAKKWNDAPFSISATASSGLTVTFTSSDPSIALVSGNTITIKKNGSVTITASQAGDNIWDPALSVQQTLTITGKQSQTISFNALPAKKANDADFTITATATSGLAVTFTSSDPSIASVSGNTVTIKKAGSVTITASQTGDDTWGAASSVAQTLTITKINQTILFDVLPTKKISDASFTIAASASSGLAITFTSSDPSIASVSGNTINLKKTGTVSITASQAGDDTWNAIAATQKLVITSDQLATQAQTIAFSALPGKSANDAPFTISATSTSGLVVTFTSSDPSIASVSGNTVTIKKTGTVTITADQVGDNTWAPAASVAQTLTIGKNAQTITFSTLPAKKVGDAAFELAATASSGLPVTYTSSNSSVASISGSTVTILKAGTATLTATQAGNDSWSQATAEQTLTITTTTGIGEEKEDMFSVYPNPTSDMLYFKGNGSDNIKVSIYNLLGTSVWSGMVNDKKVNVTQLPAGVYILKTSNNKETQTIRFIKQ